MWLIPVLNDNYVMVLQRGQRAAVVDPAVAEPVVRALEERQLELEAILHTHHHSDHIGGTPGLLRRWSGAAVIAAAADRDRIPLQTVGVAGGDRLEVLDEPVEVIDVPGHTRAHIAYWLPQSGHLFCGDTLFVGGCGRLFEGTPAQMHASLQRLAALPESTRVWCAHEYTEANLRWAAATAPQDGAIARRLREVLSQRAADQSTVPSSIGQERASNLFVRAADPGELARLRRSKDNWRA
ncbi:MAG: hydroxyacylglutathione hydrolase [Prochlorococcaceae cyanobacterium]